MAMFSPIPLPGADNPQFKDVADFWQQMQEMKQKRPLMEAQAQEAQANALKSQMFAKLFGQAFGGAPMGSGGAPMQGAGGYQLTNEEKSRMGSMQPGESMVVGQGQGQGGAPAPAMGGSGGSSADRAKQMLYSLGMLKETPEQTTNREIAATKTKADITNKGKLDLLTKFQNSKKAQQLEDTADTLQQYAFNNEKISNILDRNKHATGNKQALLNYLNLAGDDAGEFNNLSVPLQGKLAKELSTRGGAMVSKLAAGAKYNLAKNHDYNTGIRKATTNDIVNIYDQLNQRYKRLTGNELTQKLSPFYDTWRNNNTSGGGNVVKWKMVNGKLTKE